MSPETKSALDLIKLVCAQAPLQKWEDRVTLCNAVAHIEAALSPVTKPSEQKKLS